MTSKVFPILAALVATLGAAALALLLRLPLPFDGFAAVVAACVAFSATLVIGLAAPARFLWSDVERLRHAFSHRHGMSLTRSDLALDAIATAHGRADAMRRAADSFAEPLKDKTHAMADRIDQIARDIFYTPDTLATHRAALIRSELVEDALTTHARLRDRGDTSNTNDAIVESRAKVTAALDALAEALDAGDAREARGLLDQVDTYSATAELLLNRRR